LAFSPFLVTFDWEFDSVRDHMLNLGNAYAGFEAAIAVSVR
jgi:hypothetical protein